MFPVALDLTRIRIILVGNGEALARRLTQLQEAGAARITIFEDMDFEPWSVQALDTAQQPQVANHHYRLPESHEIRQANVLLVVGLDEQKSAVLAGIARLQGVLVWVEDKPDLCDFYFMSLLQRGDLTIAVSTNGRSPTLAREVRTYLENLFGEEWETISRTIGDLRSKLKAGGLSGSEINARIEAFIHKNNWLEKPSPLGRGLGEGGEAGISGESLTPALSLREREPV